MSICVSRRGLCGFVGGRTFQFSQLEAKIVLLIWLEYLFVK